MVIYQSEMGTINSISNSLTLELVGKNIELVRIRVTVKLHYSGLAYNVSSDIAYASSQSCHFSIQNMD